MRILYVVIGQSVVVRYSEILTILDFREIKNETEQDAWLQKSSTRFLTEKSQVKSLIVTPLLTYASPLSPQNILKKISRISKGISLFTNSEKTV